MTRGGVYVSLKLLYIFVYTKQTAMDLFVITNIHIVPHHHLVHNHDHANEQMQSRGPNDNLVLFGPPMVCFFCVISSFFY
jgi:hypothetical protein